MSRLTYALRAIVKIRDLAASHELPGSPTYLIMYPSRQLVVGVVIDDLTDDDINHLNQLGVQFDDPHS